jgi:hypothetical protein
MKPKQPKEEKQQPEQPQQLSPRLTWPWFPSKAGKSKI